MGVLRRAAACIAAVLLLAAALTGCGVGSRASDPAALGGGPSASAPPLPADMPGGPSASASPRAASAPGGSSGSASPRAAASPQSRLGPLVDPALKVGEWRHAWQVVGLLRARPPRLPVVLYFGDSTARESLVGDSAWARELRGLGVRARAFTLASHDQTFRIDRRFVEEMPRLRGLALIGVGLSRFVEEPVRGPLGRPPSSRPAGRHG